MSVFILIALGFSAFAWIPLVCVIVQKEKRAERRPPQLDHLLEDLSWQRARGELSEYEHESKVDRLIRKEWERL